MGGRLPAVGRTTDAQPCLHSARDGVGNCTDSIGAGTPLFDGSGYSLRASTTTKRR